MTATRTWSDVELLVDARAVTGEGPVWDERQGVLLWIDIPGRLLHTYDPRTDHDDSRELDDVVGAVALRRDGGLVAAVLDGFAALDPITGRSEGLARVERDAVPPTRMNDGKCDPSGRFWAGTMTFDLSYGAAGLYCLEGDGQVHTVLDDVSLSNGLDWSPDGQTFYYIDSLAGGVDAFDFDPATGALARRRRLVDIPKDEGLPDGMTVDADGYLWVAIYLGGCVKRYAPDGTLDGVVEMPVRTPTCPTFGGEDLTDLYVTTAAMEMDKPSTQPGAGGLYRCRVGVEGRVANRFAGPA